MLRTVPQPSNVHDIYILHTTQHNEPACKFYCAASKQSARTANAAYARGTVADSGPAYEYVGLYALTPKSLCGYSSYWYWRCNHPRRHSNRTRRSHFIHHRRVHKYIIVRRSLCCVQPRPPRRVSTTAQTSHCTHTIDLLVESKLNSGQLCAKPAAAIDDSSRCRRLLWIRSPGAITH